MLLSAGPALHALTILQANSSTAASRPINGIAAKGFHSTQNHVVLIQVFFLWCRKSRTFQLQAQLRHTLAGNVSLGL